MNPEIISKEPMSLVEVKKELKKIEKRDEELNFRAGKTLDYVNEMVSLSEKKYKELFEQIKALEIPRLKEVHIKKLLDLMPKSEKHIKFILNSYSLTVNNDNIKKLYDILNF